MSNNVYKTITNNDKSFTPIETNKLWEISSANASASYGILTYQAISGSTLDSEFRNSGTSNGYYKRLVWKSINHNLYDQYRINPYAGGERQRLIDIGSDFPLYTRGPRKKKSAETDGTVFIPQAFEGLNVQTIQNEYGFANQAGLTPTQLGASASVLSIPKNIYGTGIQRGTFELYSSSAGGNTHIVTENGKGQLISASIPIGDIFYDKGLAVITHMSHSAQNLIDSYTLKFRGVHHVHQYEYTCRATEREYNQTLNPTLLEGDSLMITATAVGHVGGEKINLDFNKPAEFQPNTISSGPSGSLNQTLHSHYGTQLDIAYVAASASNYLKLTAKDATKKYAYIRYEEKSGVNYQLTFNYIHGNINGRVFNRQPSTGTAPDKWTQTLTQIDTGEVEIQWSGSRNGLMDICFGAEGAAGKYAYYNNIVVESGENTTTMTKLKGMATHSAFQPYITTVGLYNDYNELLAVGKLPKPIKKPDKYDILFKIKFDK